MVSSGSDWTFILPGHLQSTLVGVLAYQAASRAPCLDFLPPGQPPGASGLAFSLLNGFHSPLVGVIAYQAASKAPGYILAYQIVLQDVLTGVLSYQTALSPLDGVLAYQTASKDP